MLYQKEVSHYDFECSGHVSGGFPKKVCIGEGGWDEFYPFFFRDF